MKRFFHNKFHILSRIGISESSHKEELFTDQISCTHPSLSLDKYGTDQFTIYLTIMNQSSGTFQGGYVPQNTRFGNNVDIANNAIIEGNLVTKGGKEIGGDLTVDGDFHTKANATIDGNASVTDLQVTGSITGEPDFTGDTTFLLPSNKRVRVGSSDRPAQWMDVTTPVDGPHSSDVMFHSDGDFFLLASDNVSGVRIRGNSSFANVGTTYLQLHAPSTSSSYAPNLSSGGDGWETGVYGKTYGTTIKQGIQFLQYWDNQTAYQTAVHFPEKGHYFRGPVQVSEDVLNADIAAQSETFMLRRASGDLASRMDNGTNNALWTLSDTAVTQTQSNGMKYNYFGKNAGELAIFINDGNASTNGIVFGGFGGINHFQLQNNTAMLNRLQVGSGFTSDYYTPFQIRANINDGTGNIQNSGLLWDGGTGRLGAIWAQQSSGAKGTLNFATYLGGTPDDKMSLSYTGNHTMTGNFAVSGNVTAANLHGEGTDAGKTTVSWDNQVTSTNVDAASIPGFIWQKVGDVISATFDCIITPTTGTMGTMTKAQFSVGLPYVSDCNWTPDKDCLGHGQYVALVGQNDSWCDIYASGSDHFTVAFTTTGASTPYEFKCSMSYVILQ